MGPDRVKKELLPFLREVVDQGESEESTAAIAAQLGEFVEVGSLAV